MAKSNKKPEGNGKKKNLAWMATVTVLALFVSMVILRETVFYPSLRSTVPAQTDPEDSGTTSTTDPAAPPVAQSTTPEVPTAPATDVPQAGEEIGWAAAQFHEVSVGSADNRDGFTAVFSDRGGTMPVLRFIDGPKETGKPTYVRTPVDPGESTRRDDPDRTLLLLGPTGSLTLWRYNPATGENEAVPDGSHFIDPFPERLAPGSGPFNQIWEDGQPVTYSLTGSAAWLNNRRWEHLGTTKQEDGSAEIRFRFNGGENSVTVTRTYRLYPGFKVACEITVTAGPAMPAQTMRLGMYGPVGIREDLYKAERAGVMALFQAGNGLVYEHYDKLFGSPVSSAISKHREELMEQGRNWRVNEVPASKLHGTEPEFRLMLNGLSNGYFVAAIGSDALLPEDVIPGGGIVVRRSVSTKLDDQEYAMLDAVGSVTAATWGFPTVRLEPGQSVTRRTVLYAGPNDSSSVQKAFLAGNPALREDGTLRDRSSWDDLVYVGWPAFITAPLNWLLGWLQSLVGITGLAIICLTLVVRFAISPLSVKAQVTMQVHGDKMRRIKPKLDAVREKYKGNSSRDAQMLMFQETRAVMKANNVSLFPLGGCFILLLQMPIFFALYSSVRTSFMLRHESFLWIEDLARPDTLFGISLAWDIPILAAAGFLTLNLLPILWTLLLIFQQKLQPKPTDPQQAKMQRQMSFILPIMGVLFYAMPAGFTLYFVVSSIYSFIETRLVKFWLIKTGRIEPHAGVGGMGAM